MLWWDDMLIKAMERMNLKTVSGARYMDDIRIWLHSIRLGWRVIDGVLQYRKALRDEERDNCCVVFISN